MCIAIPNQHNPKLELHRTPILSGETQISFIFPFLSAKSASLSRFAADKKTDDTNKTILPIDILPCGNRPLALHKVPSGPNLRVPAMGIL